MNYTAMITRHEFERALTAEKIRPLQIVYAAMASGVVAFAAVIGILAESAAPEFSGDAGVLIILSGTHAAMAAAVYTVAPIILRRVLTIGDGVSKTELITVLIGRMTTAHIVRLAMFEGMAMYGLVICLLMVMWGALPYYPELLLNGISAVIFLGVTTATFPTTDRIGNIFATHYQ